MKILTADWSEIKTWWSMRISAVSILLLAAIPPIADNFPSIQDTLLGWFPRNGHQWIPILGFVLTVVSRIISQSAIINMFRKKNVS